MARQGEVFEHRIFLSEEMVQEFSFSTGDINPLHFDEEYAERTIYGQKVVQGAFLVSSTIGVLSKVFGVGGILCSLKADFKAAVPVNSEVLFRTEIVKRIRKQAVARTECLFQDKVVMSMETEVVVFNHLADYSTKDSVGVD